jgi:ferrochelatase
MKKGILLINVGTPEAPTKTAVRSYLKEFLNDPYVIEMPALFRKILVNGIIVPFRAGKSAKRYQKLWTNEGSPLLVHLNNLQVKLQKSVGQDYSVFAAMSYGQPKLKEVLKEIEAQELDKLIVLPLYPHYTTSTTLSAIESVKALTSHWKNTPIQYITSFYQESAFIKAISERITSYNSEEYDHILFSYHSLPLKQVKASCKNKDQSQCYDKACYATTQLIASELNLEEANYSTAFQSRFSKRWLAPYTNDVLEELAQQGKKRVLVVTPSFVADCLETTVEIGEEYRDIFIEKGGSELQLVPCLNDADYWVEALKKIICNYSVQSIKI